MRFASLIQYIGVFVLFLINMQGWAQAGEFRASYHLGAGQFMMQELKSLNSERLEGIAVNAKILQNYPIYLTHTLVVSQNFSDFHRLGLSFEHQSTGSRISYKDYSGELTLDTRLTANSIGMFYEGYIAEKKGIDLACGSYLYLNFSSLQFDNFIRVNSETQSEKINFNSQGISLQPFFSASKQIKSFILGTELSAYLNIISRDLYLQQNKDATLVNNDGNTIRPDWTGLRFKARISYIFSNQ